MAVIKSPLPPIPIENGNFSERLLDALWDHAVKNPAKKAMISAENPGYFITWKQMYLNSLAVTTFLEQRGFGHGDVAAVVLPNCFEFLQLIIGAAARGGAISGASTLFTDYELERQFKDSKSKIVFAADQSLDRVLKAAKKCPNVQTIVVVQIVDRSHVPEDLPFGVVKYSDVIAIQPQLCHHKTDINVHRDILLLPYSSGTTGSPKGVMINHRNFSTMVSIFVNHYDRYFWPVVAPDWNFDKEAILLSLPFYHIYGVGLLMQCAIKGQTGIVMTHFDKHVYCRAIQDFKIRTIYLVPPIMVVLANDPVVHNYDLSSLEFIMTGAAPCGADLCQKLQKLLPNLKRIDQAYGMTECSMACTMPFPAANRDTSTVGRLLSNFEAKIIDENGKVLEIGEVGQLCIRSPTIMMGYLGKPQATAESVDDQGWYHTGDIARIDKDGFIYVVDRLKELIKVKGLQVAPAELEDLLLSHPDISDAAVIGIPDEHSGEIPKAFVVRKTDRLTEQQIMEFVAEKTAPYKHLKGGVEFLKEIPKSAAGKILRRFLRETSNQTIKSKM